MGEREIVNQIISYVPTIDWSSTPTSVSLFGTTIRYLGGMLSGYDLLSGPLAHLADNPAHIDALLQQSMHLANNLSYAFETPSGVPWDDLDLSTRGNSGEANSLASVGTLIMEWVHLSDLSGNQTYAEMVEKAESYLLNPSPAFAEPFPGLLGMHIDPVSGQFLDARGGLNNGADSFYEYLLKMYIYDPARYQPLFDRWILAANSTMTYLASHPLTRPDLTFFARFNGTNLQLVSDHLGCFAGGMFTLGGQILGSREYFKFGLSLVDGCHETYAATTTNIGPEVFGWDPHTIPAGQRAFFAQNGFYILNTGYHLRPEVIEGYYHAYRATGNRKYQDWAWDAFVAISAATRVGSGYSTIQDVRAEGGGIHVDITESFWFAEVLKYSYLIQVDDDAEWQVSRGGNNKWVWNTEGHPVRIYRRWGG
jgi:mannosyl-oligosaccharide alpha-1,2-mannosidase